MYSVTLSQAAAAAPSDTALVARASGGDAAAWRQLYEKHIAFAYRTARRLGVAAADTEDVVHDAFAVAWRKLAEFQTGQFANWLYQIIRHEVWSHLRKVRVRSFFTGAWAAERADEAVESPEGVVEARHSLAAVEGVLSKLSLKKREVFVLFEFEGLAHEQIAAMLGCPAETVRTRLHAARREFEAVARKRGVWP